MKDKLYDIWINNDEYASDKPYDSGLTLAEVDEVTYWLIADAYCCSGEIEVKFVGKTNIYEHLCRKELIQKELLLLYL